MIPTCWKVSVNQLNCGINRILPAIHGLIVGGVMLCCLNGCWPPDVPREKKVEKESDGKTKTTFYFTTGRLAGKPKQVAYEQNGQIIRTTDYVYDDAGKLLKELTDMPGIDWKTSTTHSLDGSSITESFKGDSYFKMIFDSRGDRRGLVHRHDVSLPVGIEIKTRRVVGRYLCSVTIANQTGLPLYLNRSAIDNAEWEIEKSWSTEPDRIQYSESTSGGLPLSTRAPQSQIKELLELKGNVIRLEPKAEMVFDTDITKHVEKDMFGVGASVKLMVSGRFSQLVLGSGDPMVRRPEWFESEISSGRGKF